MARTYHSPEAEMGYQSEQDGIPSNPEEQIKRPYEKPKVTKRPITRAEKEKLLAEHETTSRAKGKASGSR
jgi:hypothetical protein